MYRCTKIQIYIVQIHISFFHSLHHLKKGGYTQLCLVSKKKKKGKKKEKGKEEKKKKIGRNHRNRYYNDAKTNCSNTKCFLWNHPESLTVRGPWSLYGWFHSSHYLIKSKNTLAWNLKNQVLTLFWGQMTRL